jgi:hypothetical protein
MPINRRDFIKLSGVGLLGGLPIHSLKDSKVSSLNLTAREFHGADLSGWKKVLGDGIYAEPGEPAVNNTDIDTLHYGSYSELQANVHARRIMAHNITYQRIQDAFGLRYNYSAGFSFRLPYLPVKGKLDLNAQTLEGGIFVWDGANTRLDYGLGFQWMLNPGGSRDAKFGTMRCWTDTNGGSWENIGYSEPDTVWHELGLCFDMQKQTTAFTIDGIRYPACFTSTPKPANWGRGVLAGIQVEIISIYPGTIPGAEHKAEFKDWHWNWEPFGA